jgi:hypothetical protein
MNLATAQPSLDAALFDLAEYRAAATERQYRTALLALEIAEDQLDLKSDECKELEAALTELETKLAAIRLAGRPAPAAEAVAYLPGYRAQRPLVVVPCGQKKLDRVAAAAELYTGSLFRSAYLAGKAISKALDAELVILSAKHGLVAPNAPLEPYDVCLTDAEAMPVYEMVLTAGERGYLDRPALILGGAAYVERARHIWPNCEAPLTGCKGIGDMRGRLAELRRNAEKANEVER